MQVRPLSQTIPTVRFAAVPSRRELPETPPVGATQTGVPETALPRFGQFAKPVSFAGRVEHAVLINRLDQEGNPAVNQLRQLHPDLVELNETRKTCEEAVRNAGLDPNDVHFSVVPEDTFLRMAARNGFLERYPHWSWGQEFFTKFKMPIMQARMERKTPPFIEVIRPNVPTQAFLPDVEPNYAKKVRILMSLARSDFYKNNGYYNKVPAQLNELFADDAQIIKEMGRTLADMLTAKANSGTPEEVSKETGIHPADIERFVKGKATAEEVGKETVEEFIDKAHSLKNLVDIARGPRKLNDAPNPNNPEFDILGYLIKHSPAIISWQRDILEIFRRETYALMPQEKTNIIGSGWSYFWADRINGGFPKLWDFKNLSREVRWTSKIFRQDPVKLNPHQVGFEIWRHIEKDLKKKYEGDPQKNAKVLQELRDIRSTHYDVSFIRDYLTQDTVEALLMYNYDPDKQGTGSQKTGTKLKISTKDYEEIKARLIEMYQNAGQPAIGIIDGNYEEEGELRLHHVYAYDLKDDYARKTLLNLAKLWGGPVTLETRKTDDKGKQEEVVLFSDGETVAQLNPPKKKDNARNVEGMRGEWF